MLPSSPDAAPSEALAIHNNVLVAEEGWLFLHGGAHHQFAFLLGERTPDPDSVANFWSNIESRARFCADRGWPYLHVVFPSKPVVMTRVLPEALRERVQSLYLRTHLPAAPPGAADHVLYPAEALRTLDATDLPFQLNDTHLSHLGSATVAQAALGRWGMAYDLKAQFERADSDYRGDLAAMLDRWDLQPRVVLQDKAPGPLEFDNRQYLQGNGHNIAILHNPHSTTAQRLAVVGDSFFREALRYLAPVFRDILYLRGPGFHPDALSRFGPDAVMTGNAERYLASTNLDQRVPDILAALARQPDYHPDLRFQAALAEQLSQGTPLSVGSTDEIARLKRRLAKSEAALAELRGLLQTRGAEMRALRERKDARIQALRQQVESQEQRLAEAERHVAAILSGASRRLAGPFRRLAAVLRRPG